MNIYTILNSILDPYKFNLQFKNNEDIQINKNLNKYYQYINKHIAKNNKLTRLRIISNFVYSMNYFYQLNDIDLFPYDNYNNIYKILIAEKMNYMYKVYHDILFQNCLLSFNTINLYYVCCQLKKKINQYKKLGKLAWDEIINSSIEDIYDILYNIGTVTKTHNTSIYQNINKDLNKQMNNVYIIIQYGLFINNPLYLQELKQYIINHFDIFSKYFDIQLIYLNNHLYKYNIQDIKFENMIYSIINNKIVTTNNKIDTLKQYLYDIDIRTTIYTNLINQCNSLNLLKKI